MIYINKKSRAYTASFYDVFKSMQLSGAYVLYYELDWSKNQVIEFHNYLTKHSKENEDGKIKVNDIISIVRKIGFDCREETSKFPYRTKLKMYESRYNKRDIVLVSTGADDAVGVYITLAAYTLMKNYNFDQSQLNLWCEKLKEFCKLYTEGMKDKHVLKYFDQECNLKITED